jgi:hypothetical protein
MEYRHGVGIAGRVMRSVPVMAYRGALRIQHNFTARNPMSFTLLSM